MKLPVRFTVFNDRSGSRLRRNVRGRISIDRVAAAVMPPKCVYTRRRARDDRRWQEATDRLDALPPPPGPPAGMAHVFSNGSEYDYYTARNCDRCAKAGDPGEAGSSCCEMFEAIHDAATGDGYIPLELAERAGLRDYHCQEIEL